MSATLTAYEWLQLVGLGGLAGAVGQGLRAVVGLKKVHDASSASDAKVSDLIAPSRLFASLAIGAVAGALAGATTIADVYHVSLQQILALVGAGYAGADFIEGLVSRIVPAAGVPAGQESIGTGPATGSTEEAVG